MKTSLMSFCTFALVSMSFWASYRFWQTEQCRNQTLDLLSLSHFDEGLKRKLTLGELLQNGELSLRACQFPNGVELIWQSRSVKNTSTTPIKLVDKVPVILYFKYDSKLYSWASGASQVDFEPIALPKIKSLIEK